MHSPRENPHRQSQVKFELGKVQWTCEPCGALRDDWDISVLTYPLVAFEGWATRNVRYCNDNSECLQKAVKQSKTGK